MATQASTMCTVPETILATLIRTSMSCWFSNAISALVSVEQVHVDTNDGTVTIDTSQLDSAKWQQLMCLIPPSGPLLFADGLIDGIFHINVDTRQTSEQFYIISVTDR